MARASKEEPSGPALAVARFVQRTGMHAVPSIATDRSRPSRVGWTFLLMGAAVFLSFQIYKIVAKLRSYPTSTDTSILYESPMNFPAVTICNLNAIQLNKLKELAKPPPKRGRQRRQADENSDPLLQIYNVVKRKKKKYADLPPPSRSFPIPEKSITVEIIDGNLTISRKISRTKPIKGFSPPQRRQATTYKRRRRKKNSDVKDKDSIMFHLNRLSDDRREKLTYKRENLVIDCSFRGLECDLEDDFIHVMNPRYGACYIFNSGMNAKKGRKRVKKIANSGTDNGLELTLFADVNNYLPRIAPTAGFKLLVHDQGTPPMPDRDGFVLKPGAFTMLGLRASEIERAEKPYGKCKHFSKADNESMNMFLDSLPLTSPTMTTCMRTCEQSEIMYHCGCYSLHHGYSTSPAFKNFNNSVRKRPCSMSETSRDYGCMQKRITKATRKYSYCKRILCPNHECKTRLFEVSQSLASWPTKNTFDEVKTERKFLKKMEEIQVTPSTGNNTDELQQFRENFLKVLVYFEDLNVIRITTQPSYVFVDFLSDLGGQGGLWLGISAFTVIEVIVLMMQLSKLGVCFVFGRCAPNQEGERNNNQERTEDRSVELLAKC